MIRRATLYAASLPLAEPFEHASSGYIDCLEEIVLRLEDSDGVVGWGEMRANNHYVTGETPARMVGVLREAMLPRLIGADAASPRAVAALMARSIVGNPTAKALVDIAMYDLAARRAGVPVYTLLGGRRHERLHCHATLPFCEPEEAARRAESYFDAGFDTVKVRLGLHPFERDEARMAAVYDAMKGRGGALRLAADVNQGWACKEAIWKLRALSSYRLTWIEQPVRAEDHAAMRDVRRSIDVPLIADESCTNPSELLRLIADEVADGFHFKLCKAGGIANLMTMIGIAEAAGRPYMIGQMDEGMLATAAAVHCGLTADGLSNELWGYQRVATQPFTGLTLQGAEICPSDEPGLGITVHAAGLRELAVQEI
jgi:L-alanine-DL-glutamate epimerase-like enolase superfamily enzyme